MGTRDSIAWRLLARVLSASLTPSERETLAIVVQVTCQRGEVAIPLSPSDVAEELEIDEHTARIALRRLHERELITYTAATRLSASTVALIEPSQAGADG